MLIVKKFGGTSVADKERIFNVAQRCAEDYKEGNDVIIILSAMGNETDRLLTWLRRLTRCTKARDGYASNYRRTIISCFNGNGIQCYRSASNIIKCISSSNAYKFYL